ncbi:MAG: hypothetical protein ABJA78_07605 [Ferruginibacter sp.]
MELENLKSLLNESALKDHATKKNNIMELIQNKSKGPLAALEAKLKWNFYLFPVFIIFIIDFIKKPEHIHRPSIWMVIILLFVTFCDFTYNYFIVKSIQRKDATVTGSMLKQIRKLEASFKWHNNFLKIYLVIIVVLLEIIMFYHIEKDFEPWYAVSIWIRIVVYIPLIAVADFFNRSSFQKQYGQHLANLKKLAAQL